MSEKPETWFQQAVPELAGAEAAWGEGNAGRGRVGARRAAGMALKGWLLHAPRADYGTSFMHHLNALADDAAMPVGIREAAHRLAARPTPPGGFQVALPERLTPMVDARLIMDWAAGEATPRD